MGACNFIADGYTQEGFITGTPGLTEDFGFQFRPSTAHENQILQGEWERSGNNGEAVSLATAKFLEKHIVSWSGRWPDGSQVPVSVDSIGRMRGRLRLAVLDVIQGGRVADDRPAAAAQKTVADKVGN